MQQFLILPIIYTGFRFGALIVVQKLSNLATIKGKEYALNPLSVQEE